MKIKDFEKMTEKQDLVEWFKDFLTGRIQNLGMYDDDIKEIYTQAIIKNQEILKDFKKELVCK